MNRNLWLRTSAEEHIASDCGIPQMVVQVGLKDIQASDRTVGRGISIVTALGLLHPNHQISPFFSSQALYLSALSKDAYPFLDRWLCCPLDRLRHS